MNLANRLFKGDLVIWLIFMFLVVISVIEVFSASSTLAYKSTVYWEPIVDHAKFLLCGCVLVLFLHNIHCRWYALFVGGAVVSIVLLLLLLLKIPGLVVIINGEPRWMNLFGLTFQPSEIAKISLMVYAAFVLSKRNWFTDVQMFWWIEGAAMAICGLSFFTNGSTAILLFSVIQIMAFFGQISLFRLLKFWGILLAVLFFMLSLLYFTPESVMNRMPERVHTWKARIERFIDGTPAVQMESGKAVQIDGEDYQVVHGKIAIARGGLWGKFPGHGQQRDFLPQAYSDFIYAIIIEETGIVGGMFVLFLYMALLVRVGMIARKCDKLFPKFLVLGCGLMLVVQALINMAVAVDLIPVTGQPLPLVSRGGTSTIISCAYIGIILSVSRFGANIGNEEETDTTASDSDSMSIEPEMDENTVKNGWTSVDNETDVLDDETNLIESVVKLKEETTTERSI